MSTWWCEKCGVEHAARCPVLSEKRREQVRTAQQRYRDRKKAESAEGVISDLKAQVAKLEGQLKVARAHAGTWQRAAEKAEARLTAGGGVEGCRDLLGIGPGRGVKVAWRKTMGVVHPDKHAGSLEAVRLAQLVNRARERLG